MSAMRITGLIVPSDSTCASAQLRKLAWNGVPSGLRPAAWPLLLVRMEYTFLDVALTTLTGLSTVTLTPSGLHVGPKTTGIPIACRTRIRAKPRGVGPTDLAPD